MPIVNTSFSVGHAQIDGRVYVTETHIDQFGEVFRIEYLSPPNLNHSLIASDRVAILNADLAAREAAALLSAEG